MGNKIYPLPLQLQKAKIRGIVMNKIIQMKHTELKVSRKNNLN